MNGSIPNPAPRSPIFRWLAVFGIAFALLSTAFTQSASEKRIVVGGLNAQGHFVYAFKGSTPLVHVSTTVPALPKSIRLSNRSGRSLKIQFFNGDDAVRAIPRQTLTLANGKAHSMPFQIYHAKVFEPGVFDRLAATPLSIGSDAEIRTLNSHGRRAIVVKPSASLFSVHNGTKEALQVSVFRTADTARIVPYFILHCPPGKSTVWRNPIAGKFVVRVHPDRALASPLSAERIVNAHSSVAIQSMEWAPWKPLMRMKSVNGRLSESVLPIVVPALDGITVDPMGYTPSGRDRNFRHPRLYARAKGNRLWSIRLDDSTVRDGMSLVERSTDWRLTDGDGGVTWPFGTFTSTPFVANQELVFSQSLSGEPIVKPLYVPVPLDGMNTRGAWTSLGKGVKGRPIGVAYGPKQAPKYFALRRDPIDNSLRAIGRDQAGRWGEWQNLGGAFRGDPAAAALFEGSYDSTVVNVPNEEVKSRIHVFARGVDNTLMHRIWRQESGWGPWDSLGGHLSSSPNVHGENILSGPENNRTFLNRIHVVAKGLDGVTMYRMFDGAKWTAWTLIGPALASDPVVFVSEDIG